MRKYLIILCVLAFLIFTGFGCRDQEYDQAIENSAQENNSYQNFVFTDCPPLQAGWEEKTSSRFVGIDETENKDAPMLFDHGDVWGLRCRYYEPNATEFDITHDEGRSTGTFVKHYELELRRFKESDAQEAYYDAIITDQLNSYCRNGSEVVMPTLLNGQEVERYQCEWPSEKSGDSWDQINTNTLIHFLKYKDSVITLAVVKEQGRLTFIPPDYAAIADDYNSHAFQAALNVYESTEFQVIPEEYTNDLLTHAMQTIDNF